MPNSNQQNLPSILAGPIVRQASPEQVCFWLVTKYNYRFTAKLFNQNTQTVWFDGELTNQQITQVQVGKFAFVNLLTIKPLNEIPCDSRVSYDLSFINKNERSISVSQVCADLLYSEQSHPSFIVSKNIKKILHGSCRKPHHNSDDGLCVVDNQLEKALKQETDSPNLLMMSGDQIYADDVAGPTLVAIKQTIEKLGLFHEDINGAIVKNSKEIFDHTFCYYQRPKLLPDTKATVNTYKKFFTAKQKPIFTSANANNHLISFAEILAMYILTWSPEMWRQITISDEGVTESFKPLFAKEKVAIEKFINGLPLVRRALAHIPVYMIFDDHDITDDWNLTRGWEEAVYQNEFAKRIVGNALIGYWLCQGWGNDPKLLQPLFNTCSKHFTNHGITEHDKLVNTLLSWEHWHYSLDTFPKVVVLDTRTQRWRSESSLTKPSGLMDWEALCDLQQELIGQNSVIMVSAAPIFGVKLIETIQRIFTFFGKALTVDAENWMAHKGTASVILNIFRNRKTPPNFVILSGDVHYSFVYDISLRFRQNSPHITQITSSGIKNQFPEKLLTWLDSLNHIFYNQHSPLNWFTQRRNMLIQNRKLKGNKVQTLLNSSGIGLLEVDRDCLHLSVKQLTTDGKEIIFEQKQ